MICQDAQKTLLEAESLHAPDWPSDLREHVEACAECQGLADKLVRLQDAWKGMPIPPQCDSSQAAFLLRIPALARRRRFLGISRWAMAAALMIGAGILFWLAAPNAHVQAGTNLVQHLVEWNVQLVHATEADRPGLFSRQAEQFQQALLLTRLPAEDKELAQSLLDNGAWLADNPTPLEVVDRLDRLAEKMHRHLDRTLLKGQAKDSTQMARHYVYLTEKGLRPHFEKMKKHRWSRDEMTRLETLYVRDGDRSQDLQTLLERIPEPTRHEVRKALGLTGKKNKGKK